MRFIPTKVHGMLDYSSVLLCLILPRALNLSERTTTLLTIVALTALVYTVLTRFELGFVRVLPTKLHLLLDFFSGTLLCAAPFLIVPGASQRDRRRPDDAHSLPAGGSADISWPQRRAAALNPPEPTDVLGSCRSARRC